MRRECGGNGAGEAIPTVGFFLKAFSAGDGKFVELGAAIVVRRAPVRLEQALADEAEEAGLERALFDEQGVGGDLPDAEKNAVPMERAQRHGSQNEEIESAGKKLSLVVQGITPKLIRKVSETLLSCQGEKQRI